jgi:hypothetical protein
MSLTYGFYNSVNHDRPYNTTQISKLFDGLILDGIFMAIGTRMVVKATTGMGFKVGIGRAWFNHTWTDNDADLPMSFEASDILLDRIDAVILEVDSSDPVRANSIKILKGTPASTPVKPTLTNTEFIHQYPLCYATIGKNVTEITDAVIENTVGTSACPFATGVIQGMNIDDLIAQWNSEFDAWFQRMKDQLSTDAAGNLQSQIDAHLADKDNPHEDTPDKIGAVAKARPYLSCTSNTTLTPEQSGEVVAVNTAGITITLPITIQGKCWEYTIQNNTSGNVTISTSGSPLPLIGWDGGSGTSTYTMLAAQVIKICSDGWNWFLSSNSKSSGNNKNWLATTVVGDSEKWVHNLTIPNFKFSEGCQVTFKTSQEPHPESTPDGIRIIIAGDTNKNGYCIFTQGLQTLDPDAWASGSTITLTLSNSVPPGWGAGQNCGTAFFKGGAGTKEFYDFPLSMQSAAPTPVNANHIWIVNDTKMNFTIDEAIRSGDWGNDNRYYGIVDNTDNNYMFFESPKKTTDGSPILCTNRHMAKDTAPFHLGYLPVGKKYGLPFTCDNWVKWPRIYSRIGGVVDIETAMRWDGSAWQYLSQKGHYALAVGPTTAAIWNRAGAVLSPHANQLPAANSSISMDVSKDGMYTVVALGIDLYFYKRTGDSFNCVSHLQTAYTIYQVSFSPDGSYLAVAASTQVLIYKKQTDGTFAILVDLGRMGTSGNNIYTVCWSPTGNKVMCCDCYSYVGVYNRSADSFTLKAISGQLYGSNLGIKNLQWMDESTACAHTDGSVNAVFTFNPNGPSFYKAYPSEGGYFNGLSHPVASLSSRKLIAKDSVSNKINLWNVDNETTPVSYLAFDSTVLSVFVSPDEKYVFVLCESSINAVAINADFTLSLIWNTPITYRSLINLAII